MIKRIGRCRICGNRNLIPVLDLGTQALTGFFSRTREEQIPRSPLELVKCHGPNPDESCGLLQLRHSVDPGWIYGLQYGYRSGINPSMAAHLKKKSSLVEKIAGLSAGDLVLDIGSNDGTLLNSFSRKDLDLAGIDPAAEKFQGGYPGNIRLIPDFFSARIFRRHFSGKKAKAVTSIAMFYDLESPLEFMRDVYEILDDDGVWIFEQSYLPEMLKHNAYDMICHEHLEYYGLSQIKWMTDRAGFKIIGIEFNEINGGSFQVAAVKKGNADFQEDTGLIEAILADEKRQGLSSLGVYDDFARNVLRHKRSLQEFILGCKQRGESVFGYGASTKGNVVLQYCGFTSEDIQSIAEINEEKIGCFTPGSGIPVIREHDARALHPDYFLVLPWYLSGFVMAREENYLNNGGMLIIPFPGIRVLQLSEAARGA